MEHGHGLGEVTGAMKVTANQQDAIQAKESDDLINSLQLHSSTWSRQNGRVITEMF